MGGAGSGAAADGTTVTGEDGTEAVGEAGMKAAGEDGTAGAMGTNPWQVPGNALHNTFAWVST